MFLSGGCGFPSTKVMARSSRLRREDFDGEGVGLSGPGRGDIEFEQSPRASGLIGGSYLLAVEPHVDTEVDAVEAQPDDLAAVLGLQLELRAIPPGTAEGTVWRHGRIREIRKEMEHDVPEMDRRFIPM